MTSLRINISSSSLDAAFVQVSPNRDTRLLMRQIAGDLSAAVNRNFQQEGRPKWLPLKPSTIKQRTKKGYWPGRILQRTGRLAASISSESGVDYARVGTVGVVAAVQQLGTTRAGRKRNVTIPARPFLAITQDDLQEIEQKVVDFYSSP